MPIFALMRETVDYIIRFLLDGNDSVAARVGFTADAALFRRYAVVIVPSSFWDDGIFGTLRAEPCLPLAEIEGVPLLFGEPQIVRVGSTLVVRADVVASAFYLLSRYEEWLHSYDLRDVHGRFIGQKSLLARAGVIHRPLVDEYGVLLRRWLREAGCAVQEPAAVFSSVYLTHDVDTVAFYRHIRGFLGGVKRSLFGTNAHLCDVLRAQTALTGDPAYMFPWLVAQDAKLPQAHKLYFVKAAVKSDRFDYPQYRLRGADAQQLFELLRDNGCEIGLHASYFSGAHSEFIPAESAKLQSALSQLITANRWHYLRTLQPADCRALLQAGITDDFTMGYADVAGFRLGTCRAVRWIDPQTGEVTSLTLHPLTVMDCTLSNPNYMGLPEEQAAQYVFGLLDEVKQHHGEVVLLWHNTSLNNQTYHSRLYRAVLDYMLP